MFERETRREKILEAINLQKETQLRMKNKGGFLNILAGKKKSAQIVPEENEEVKVKVDPLVEAENEFYRILNEVDWQFSIVHQENQFNSFFTFQVKESRKDRDPINEYEFWNKGKQAGKLKSCEMKDESLKVKWWRMKNERGC